MKRQKRDRLERAHSQGFKAGLAGRSKSTALINKLILSLSGLVVVARQ